MVYEVGLAHPIAAVWDGITRKSLVDKYYFAPLGADMSEAGKPMYYGAPAKPAITGTVIAYRAPQLLEHSFRFAGDSSSPDTVVTYRLAATGKGTRVRIEHRGYPGDSQGYSDVSLGWPILMDRLDALLDGQP